MNFKTLLLLLVTSIPFIVYAQYTNHESLLKKSSKFDLGKYTTYKNLLKVSGNFVSEQTPSKTTYLKSKSNEQSINFYGKNIGRVVVYSRLFKKVDSLPHKGDLRIHVYKKGIKNPVLTFLKSFEYYTGQEFHYNFTSTNIERIKFTYSNDNNNYWVIEKLKVSELNQNGVDTYKTFEEAVKERNNLKENWKKNRDNDLKRIKKAITYIRKQDEFVKFIENKKDTDELEASRNKLYNPTSNSDFDNELNELLKNVSIRNIDDFREDYENLKKGNWNNIITTVDEVLTGGKFQSLINLIGGLFNSGKHKTNSNKEFIYTKLNEEFYAAEFNDKKKYTFRPINHKDNKGISLSSIKKRQKKIKALQEYVSILREFQLQDLQKQEKYKSQIVSIKNEMEKLKNAWVNFVITINPSKDYDKLEEASITNFIDNDVLGPISNSKELEEYEKYFSAISKFDDKVRETSLNLQSLASDIKNYNDNYYISSYKDIVNKIGRVSLIKKIQNLPKNISIAFHNKVLTLESEYRKSVEKKLHGYTLIKYSDKL